jgi:hypothetical protein
MGLLSCGGDEAFQTRDAGAYDLVTSELFTRQLEQERRFVML